MFMANEIFILGSFMACVKVLQEIILEILIKDLIKLHKKNITLMFWRNARRLNPFTIS